MTSHNMNSRQRSAHPGDSLRDVLQQPDRRAHRSAVRSRRAPLSLPPGPVPVEGGTLVTRTSIMLLPILTFFSEMSTGFWLFRPFLDKRKGRQMPSFPAFSKFSYHPATWRSQERMVPFSSSKVVVLTMWVLPTRISWVPSSLVRLSLTVPSMVKTRS